MKEEEIDELDFGKWPLPPEYLQEIGRVTALWSSLESFLNLALAKLAGFNNLEDPKPFIIFVHLSFPQRLDIMGALCENLVTNHAHLKNYKEVIVQLRTAQQNRNKLIHNMIFFNPETGQFETARGSARGTLKTTIEPIKLRDIKRAVIEISNAEAALYQLILKRKIEPAWKISQNLKTESKP
jgi:hypothetical protein